MSYCDYDCEAEPNFPEVEEIINESTDKFQKFMRDTFVNEYRDIDNARKSIATQRAELNTQERLIREKELKLQARETELAKSEEVQYGKLKTKWFTELGLAFDIDDTVYYYKDVIKRVDCPTCNGNKKVKAKVESANSATLDCELACPTCNGYGTVLGEREYEVVEATVIQIDAHIKKYSDGSITIKHSSDFSYELITCVWVRDKKGNNSQQIKGCNLYKSKEECEKAVKALKERK